MMRIVCPQSSEKVGRRESISPITNGSAAGESAKFEDALLQFHDGMVAVS
jgi:hypothetical protein